MPSERVAAGLKHQEGLADELGDRVGCLLTWRSPQALIVGPRDAELPRFGVAVGRLAAVGWPVVVRRSGGGACPVSLSTIQIAIARPARLAMTVDTAYGELAAAIVAALGAASIHASIAPREDAFCPGRYDLAVNGRKVAGLSQHWRLSGGRFVVTTAAVVIGAEEPRRLATVVNLFYLIAGGATRCSAAAIGTVAYPALGDLIAAHVRDLVARVPTAPAALSLH